MVFIQGSYDIPTTIGLITQALVATDDFEMVDEAALDNYNQTGVCIKHIPSDQYITFIAGRAECCRYNNNGYRTATQYGMRVIFSGSFDTETHTYTAATKIHRGHVPLRSRDGSIANITTPNVFSTSLWIDKYGVIGTIQNTYDAGIGVFFALEFFPQTWVEYDDAEEFRAVFYAKRASDSEASDESGLDKSSQGYGGFFVRPYRYQSLTYASTTDHEGAYMEREAYRSEGNNKVYFKFPTYENDSAASRKPYAETRRWFRVSINGGLQIGDILNWIDPDGVTVHKYIVCVCTAGTMYYAIPYENAFDYAVSAKQ